MKIVADYHTHTKYSHGKGTIEENVQEAIRKGLKEVAIADHGPKHIGFGIKKKDLEKMRKEIDQINRSTDQIKVKLGIEANIIGLDGKIDVDQEMMKHLDILLAGYHFGALPENLIDGTKIHAYNLLAKHLPSIVNKSKILNTKAVVAAVYNNAIDVITHPGAKAHIDTKELAKAAAARNTALEINSSHGHLTVEYIKVAMKEGVKFVVSSDAHRPEDVGNTKPGLDRAIAAGVPVHQILNAEE